jgi:hypothetical protein
MVFDAILAQAANKVILHGFFQMITGGGSNNDSTCNTNANDLSNVSGLGLIISGIFMKLTVG